MQINKLFTLAPILFCSFNAFAHEIAVSNSIAFDYRPQRISFNQTISYSKVGFLGISDNTDCTANTAAIIDRGIYDEIKITNVSQTTKIYRVNGENFSENELTDSSSALVRQKLLENNKAYLDLVSQNRNLEKELSSYPADLTQNMRRFEATQHQQYVHYTAIASQQNSIMADMQNIETKASTNYFKKKFASHFYKNKIDSITYSFRGAFSNGITAIDCVSTANDHGTVMSLAKIEKKLGFQVR